ncbi:MAG TPA: hypothetical protein PK794_04210 [Armatimonadota bacterium]|nr:hypothetical protein [Armatimonadota bacterium]
MTESGPPSYAPSRPAMSGAPVMSVGEWFVVLLVLAIPILNLIMALVWAFGSPDNEQRANFCKAALIWMLIWIVLSILSWGALAAVIAGMMGAGGGGSF